MTCANCDATAVYVYDPKPLAPTAYCSDHLPSFLKQAAKAGSLPTTEAFTQRRETALSTLKSRRRRATPKEEEPVVEAVSEDAAPETDSDAE
jgi:hypothetical protein